jgi:hypothetical protein
MSEPKGIIEQWWERLKNNKEWNLARSPGMWKLILILAGGLFLLIYAGSWVSPKEKSSISPGYQAAEKKGEEGLSTAEKELERRTLSSRYTTSSTNNPFSDGDLHFCGLHLNLIEI